MYEFAIEDGNKQTAQFGKGLEQSAQLYILDFSVREKIEYPFFL